jgi:hypothetical protein
MTAQGFSNYHCVHEKAEVVSEKPCFLAKLVKIIYVLQQVDLLMHEGVASCAVVGLAGTRLPCVLPLGLLHPCDADEFTAAQLAVR